MDSRGDPVNLVLTGEFDKLRAAFLAAGWTEAEPLNLTSSWRLVVAFVLNRPYPAAPFSTLFSCSGARRTSASRKRST